MVAIIPPVFSGSVPSEYRGKAAEGLRYLIKGCWVVEERFTKYAGHLCPAVVLNDKSVVILFNEQTPHCMRSELKRLNADGKELQAYDIHIETCGGICDLF